MTATPPAAGLKPLQADVARTFFSTAASDGFVLAGGGAMLAQGLSNRPTRDLDFFTAPESGDVALALVALETACEARGWSTRRVSLSQTFARVVVTGPHETVDVDLAVDGASERPPTVSVVGPTLDPEDLAARKLLALFARAEARDFADVHRLAAVYGAERLLELAAELDAGFDRRVLADMLGSIGRYVDHEIPADDPAAVRAFALTWAARLRSGP